MTRLLTFAFLGFMTIGGTLAAQTPTRMALPTGGLNPPAMTAPQPAKNSVQPVSGTPAKTTATPATATPATATPATATPATAAPAVQPLNKSEPTPAKANPVTAAAAPAQPVLVAAQPALVETSAAKPAAPAEPMLVAPVGTAVTATPTSEASASGNPFHTASAKETTPLQPQAEWRYAQKPELPRTTTREHRTAMMQPEARSPNRIRDCLLKPIAEVQLPAQEAGVLVDLKAFEGQEVQQNQILGRVDDSQPRLQKKAAEAERNVSIEKGKSTINEQYAVKASDVARKEWEKAEESNRSALNSVSQVEVMRLKLTWEKGLLERERALEERKIENLTVLAKEVDVEAADDAIRRRHLIAPIAGTIVELTPHIGEWLKPGDPVLKIVNMEILKVEGYVNIDHFRQDQLRNQVVTALVDLGNKQQVEVQARITFVSPVVEPGGEYRLKAEIQNRKNAAGEWELKPGLNAELILKSTAPATAPRLP